VFGRHTAEGLQRSVALHLQVSQGGVVKITAKCACGAEINVEADERYTTDVGHRFESWQAVHKDHPIDIAGMCIALQLGEQDAEAEVPQ